MQHRHHLESCESVSLQTHSFNASIWRLLSHINVWQAQLQNLLYCSHVFLLLSIYTKLLFTEMYFFLQKLFVLPLNSSICVISPESIMCTPYIVLVSSSNSFLHSASILDYLIHPNLSSLVCIFLEDCALWKITIALNWTLGLPSIKKIMIPVEDFSWHLIN